MTKEIVLIIVGIIIVIVSFMISEKKSVKEREQERLDFEKLKADLKSEITENIKLEQDDLTKKNGTFLENKGTDILDRMEAEMSKLSNEKIMAFTEYGEEILGKIEQNHQEVVFLYDMLNQKESEMKQLIKEIDSSKVSLEEIVVTIKAAEKEWEEWKVEKEEMLQELAGKEIALQKAVAEEKRLTEVKEERMNEGKDEKKETPILTATDILSAKKEGKSIDYFSEMQQDNNREFGEKKNSVENSRQVVDRGPAANIDGGFSFGEISMGNTKEDSFSDGFEKKEKTLNESVLDLYSKGMSVMEIAKVLGRGQGEVKLIIDLYQG